MTLKALSVRQPWAGLIAAGLKRVENRSFQPAHRGEVAIHTGLVFDPAEVEQQLRAGVVAPFTVVGAVIAVVDLTGCHQADQDSVTTCCQPYGLRLHATRPAQHWTLENARLLDTPVPWRGQLGLWNAPAEVENAIRRQFGGGVPA